MGRFLLLTGVLGLAAATSWGTPKASGHADHADHQHESFVKAKLAFIENKGQWDAPAKYKADVAGGAMFLTDNGFVYNFASQDDLDRIHDMRCGENGYGSDPTNEIVHMHAYKVTFVGANPNPTYATAQKQPNYNNYFIGNDPSKWAGNVGMYQELEQRDIYDNINLKLYASSSSSSVKYDFVVAPNANPAAIQLRFEGTTPVIKNGALLVKTSVNEVVEEAPYTYQVINGQKVTVESRYKLEKGVLSYEFPKGYNKAYELIIDPNLVFATYSGGNQGNNYSYTTTYDDQGNLYAGADAWNVGWPVTTGAYQTTYGGGSHEVAINKYSTDGTMLIYSTYLGGTSWDLPHAMKVNDLGELVVVGSTSSSNFPTTTGCFDATLDGNFDMFVAHFNPTATALIGSTFLGGTGTEPQQFTMTTFALTSSNLSSVSSPVELTFDDNNNIWVVGNTTSTDYPVTSGAQQPTLAGGIDGVITKLNPDVSQVLYSSYFGGSANDAPSCIDFNKTKDKLVLTGITYSSNFPTTSGAMNPTFMGGSSDGFAMIVNPANGAITTSTFIGTNATDHVVSLQIDCSENIYLLGRTTGDYPITPGTWNQPGTDVFIDKLNSSLSASLVSTRLGNQQSGGDYFPSAFLVDQCGNIYIGGFSASSGKPLTPDAFQTNPVSFWFCTLLPNFSGLKYASYFGQTTSDHNHIGVNRLDPLGYFYHSICSYTPFTLTTPNVWSPNKQASGQDILSFKFNFDATNIFLTGISGQGANDTVTHAVRGCKSAFVNFRREGNIDDSVVIQYLLLGTATNGVDYQQLPGNVTIPANQTEASVEIKPLLVPNMPTGPKSVIIQVLNPCGCNGQQSILKSDTLYIYDSLYVEVSQPLPAYCPGTQISITGATDTSLDFSWTPVQYDQGNLTINPILLTTRDYTITVTQPGAPATCPPNSKTFHALVEQYPIISMPVDTIVCGQDSAVIPVSVYPDSVNYIYSWSPPTGLRASNIGTNYLYRPTGTYYYTLTVTTPLANCTSTEDLAITIRPPFQLSNIMPASGTIVDYGSEVDMSAQSATLYSWFPTNLFYDPDLQYARTLPVTQPTTYQVVGIDEYGCKDTADIFLDIKYPEDPIMPNAFTPNGDGKNDVFGLNNAKFQKLIRFEIYNRWGQQVFNTIDPMKGWDGTYNGQISAQGVYTYIITVELPNKTIKTYKGDVTLFR